jgi:hypothetical protein
MKSFKDHLQEAYPGAGDASVVPPTENAVDSPERAVFDLESSEELRALNAFVGAIGERTYINPKGALIQLQNKLSTIGLYFEIPALNEDQGTVEAELTQFGGVFGKDGTTPNDEFINEVTSGKKLVIEYEYTRTGACQVYAKIV